MKTRVGIFFGGKSVEHEVSVISAMQAIAALDAEKYEAVPVYSSKSGRLFTGAHLGEIESYRDIDAAVSRAREVELARRSGRAVLLFTERKLFSARDAGALDVALPVFHGTDGEDGVMQAMFERVSLPYAGCDVTASACGMDKWVMKALFAQHGVAHLPGVKVRRTEYYADPEECAANIAEKTGFPVIVKPINLGSSVGISKARSARELEDALETAFEYALAAVCERAVEPLREINCSVLGDCDEAFASVCEEPLQSGDLLTFADKYTRGGEKPAGKTALKLPAAGAKSQGMSGLSRRVPAEITNDLAENIRDTAIRAFHAIGASGVARIDFLMNADTHEIWVNEINTIPGSLAFYLWEASGVPFDELLDRLVRLALKRERDRAKISYTFEANLLKNAPISGKLNK